MFILFQKSVTDAEKLRELFLSKHAGNWKNVHGWSYDNSRVA